jgi:hypothetical protein
MGWFLEFVQCCSTSFPSLVSIVALAACADQMSNTEISGSHNSIVQYVKSQVIDFSSGRN